MLKKQFSKTKPTCKVTFTLPKEAVEKGKTVELVGEWNDWDQKKAVKLKSSKSGYQTTIELETGRNYEFRYWIGKSKWENDWAADGYVPNPFGFDNSVVSIVNVPTVPTKAAKKANKKATAKKSGSKKSGAKKAAAKKVTAKKATTATAEKVVAPKAKKAATKSTTTTKTTAAKKTTTARKTTATAKKATTRKTTPAKSTTTSKTVVARRVATNDDLKVIEGIGPKIAEHLNNAGIKTFAALGRATITKLKGILEQAGPRYKMHVPNSWPKQAKLAAAGKWDALQKLQDELSGGK